MNKFFYDTEFKTVFNASESTAQLKRTDKPFGNLPDALHVMSSVRDKVEHIFHIMKCQFRFRMVRFRGLDKNATHLFTNCALIHLL